MAVTKTLMFFLAALVLVPLFHGPLLGADGGLDRETGGIRFSDDFEKGLHQWDLVNPDKIRVIDSGHPAHGKVLALQPGGPAVYALIKGSENWGAAAIRVEGDVCFPYSFSHYLGLVYNYNLTGNRADFGSIYIYGNGAPRRAPGAVPAGPRGEKQTESFLLVNPHRDSNASRRIYDEYLYPLTGADVVDPGKWYHFKAEIMGPTCHFYFGDMTDPKITFEYLEFDSGRVGFKPRYTGGESWVDNVRIESIPGLTYTGPRRPAGLNYDPDRLITRWWALGPFNGRSTDVEADGYKPDKTYPVHDGVRTWKPFDTDPRGCVVAGTLCGKFDGNTRAYFYTPIESAHGGPVTLAFSSKNRLLLRLNGESAGEIKALDRAWYDFLDNPEHKGETVKLTLKPGTNHLLVMIEGGRYGGDGFFAARVAPVEEK